jgi:hypothetical protein
MKDKIVFHLITACAFTVFGYFLANTVIDSLREKLNLLDEIDVKIGQISDSLRKFNESLMEEFVSLHEDI